MSNWLGGALVSEVLKGLIEEAKTMIPLMELKKKLLDDSLAFLVVCAPPGCGKTTLVTKLFHDQDIRGIYEMI